jgi:hypothetical protein
MGWTEEKTKQEKLANAEAASTIVAYNLGYKKRVGKYGLEEWLKQSKASVLNTSSNTKNIKKERQVK